jgi:hypothetical protein
MSQSVPALLIGEAEIDRIARMLDRMGVPYTRVRTPRPLDSVPAPQKLLVVSGQCLPKLPLLEADEGNVHRRVCIHGQDFLPLRERLREKGFHYLVQTALDDTSLRVFLGQMLHDGATQRRATRLPLGGPVEYHAPRGSGAARLGDLTAESCRVLDIVDLSVGDAVTVVLPAALGGGTALPLPGHVIRARADEAAGEKQGNTAVIRFSVLDAEVAERLGRLVRGELIGTRVTPLAELPPEAPAGQGADDGAEFGSAASPPGSPRDRRREVRHPYRGRVEVMEFPGDADGALGRDLSLDGICMEGAHRLKPGMKVTLALYGGHRSTPVVVEAETIRANATEAALVFGRLSNEQQDKLATLIAEQPAVEALDPPEASRVVATRILERNR